MNYSPNKMKALLDDNNFKFKKKFGQNFIIDENIINKIVELAGIDNETLVIEIGPGAGSLTSKLCIKAKNVLCYEIDESIRTVLEKNISDYDNVDVIYKDFLHVDVNEDIKKYDYNKLYVVANLPYYITTPIITKFITDKVPVDKIVVMVQKEVGNRFKATVGTKEYNSLTIYLNYYFNIKKILDISKNIFIPKPKVDSSVIEFSKKEQLMEVKNLDFFFQIVKDSFKQKRKTLRNNLKSYDLDLINEVLKEHNLDLSVRAEKISIDIFIEIANKLEG